MGQDALVDLPRWVWRLVRNANWGDGGDGGGSSDGGSSDGGGGGEGGDSGGQDGESGGVTGDTGSDSSSPSDNSSTSSDPGSASDQGGQQGSGTSDSQGGSQGQGQGGGAGQEGGSEQGPSTTGSAPGSVGGGSAAAASFGAGGGFMGADSGSLTDDSAFTSNEATPGAVGFNQGSFQNSEAPGFFNSSAPAVTFESSQPSSATPDFAGAFAPVGAPDPNAISVTSVPGANVGAPANLSSDLGINDIGTAPAPSVNPGAVAFDFGQSFGAPTAPDFGLGVPATPTDPSNPFGSPPTTAPSAPPPGVDFAGSPLGTPTAQPGAGGKGAADVAFNTTGPGLGIGTPTGPPSLVGGPSAQQSITAVENVGNNSNFGPGGALADSAIGSAPPDPGSVAGVLSGGGDVLRAGGNLAGVLGPGPPPAVFAPSGGVAEVTGDVVAPGTPELDPTQISLAPGTATMTPDQIVAFTQAQSNLLNQWSTVISPDDVRWPQVVQMVNQQALQQVTGTGFNVAA